MGFIVAAILVLGCGTTLLLLAIFKWDWMSKYPILYLDKLQRWTGAEYDSNIRKKTIIKYAVIVALGIVFSVISVRNYTDFLSLDDCIEVWAGETVPVSGGELAFYYYVPEDSVTIVRKNFETERLSNYVVKADARYYNEALAAFTGIFTNTTQEPLTVSEKDIKMLGLSTDINYGGRIKGSWMADHKTDADGNMYLEPGESAFLYFWVVLNQDQQTYPYVYVVRDKENSYLVNLSTLSFASAEKLTQMNLNDALRELLENAQELTYDNAYYDKDLGYVTLKSIEFKNVSDVPSESGFTLYKEANKGYVYLNLTLQIDSEEKLRTADMVTAGLTVMVMTDGKLCDTGVNAVISDQKEPAGEGQRYSSEVHYEMQVPEHTRSYQIIMSFDGDTYVMVF